MHETVAHTEATSMYVSDNVSTTGEIYGAWSRGRSDDTKAAS